MSADEYRAFTRYMAAELQARKRAAERARRGRR